MTTTPSSIQEVKNDLAESHPEWPYSENRDTVANDPWPLAWDAAAFIEKWFSHPDHNDLEEAICHLPLNPSKFGYVIAEWHFQKPPETILKAHLLRIVKGMRGETALYDYLEDNPELVKALGFDDGLASVSTLWRAWNKNRLSENHKQVVRTIGQVLVNVAREHGVPAPDEVFQPDPSIDAPDSVEQDDATVREHTIGKTREIWHHAKPMVTDNFEIPRGENTEIHDNAFLEAHAFMGSRQDMYAENGTWNFAAETTRERVQTGSTHRFHLQKIGPARARENLKNMNRELIKRARRDSELVGGVMTSIDITKSNPYRTKDKIETDEDGNVTNTWLLGYKEEGKYSSTDFYFQWATIQIVGDDIPLVLDAIPVPRGMPRETIVDILLETATDLVDIDLVMMDREFDKSAVKNVCECHDVWYLNPARMRTSERAMCTRLRRHGKGIHIEHDEDETGTESSANSTLEDFGVDVKDEVDADSTTDDTPVRKRIFVPSINAAQTSDDLDNLDEENIVEDESDQESGFQQDLIEDFADATEKEAETAGRMFEDLIEEIHEEEANRDLPGNDKDTQLYMLFETNHPDIELPGDEEGELSEIEKAHMVSRVIQKYRYRWGIENAYKQIKRFRVRTTSMNHEYRFFNFLFACTLYNVWRLVDLLVKLELLSETEFEYKPLVTADLFLTIAKEYKLVGLGPPN